MIAMVKIRLLDTDENFSLRGSTVEKAIKDDRSNGFIPFFVIRKISNLLYKAKIFVRKNYIVRLLVHLAQHRAVLSIT